MTASIPQQETAPQFAPTSVGTRTSSLDHQEHSHLRRGTGVGPLPPELRLVWQIMV